MKRILCIGSLLSFVFITFLNGWAQQLSEGAKGVFYTGWGPEVTSKQTPSPPSQKVLPKTPKEKVVAKQENPKIEYMGIRYWVFLVDRDGKKKMATTERIFRGGERIKLHVESNRDGYLYIVNLGTTGQSRFLFPHPAIAGGSNFIKAHNLYEVPYKAYLRFDENPGEEVLLLVLSPNPMGEALPTSPETGTLNAQETGRLMQVAQAKGVKDLVLEIDDSGPEPASYAVAPFPSLKEGMITLQIKLRHGR